MDYNDETLKHLGGAGPRAIHSCTRALLQLLAEAEGTYRCYPALAANECFDTSCPALLLRLAKSGVGNVAQIR